MGIPQLVDNTLQFLVLALQLLNRGIEALDVFPLGPIFELEPMIGAFQVLDAHLQLLVDPQSGIVHLLQSDRLFR